MTRKAVTTPVASLRVIRLSAVPVIKHVMMSKREHKLLMLDFERMDATNGERVMSRLNDYIMATQSHPIIVFCLETVRRDDPVLRYIREWIDEGMCRDDEECEDAATFLAKVCRLCNSKVGVRACGRCEHVYYCSKDCQVSDWARHKLTCKLERPLLVGAVVEAAMERAA